LGKWEFDLDSVPISKYRLGHPQNRRTWKCPYDRGIQFVIVGVFDMARSSRNSGPVQKADWMCLLRRTRFRYRSSFGRLRPAISVALAGLIFVLLVALVGHQIRSNQLAVLEKIGTNDLAWKTNWFGYVTELYFDDANRVDLSTLQLITQLSHLRRLELPNVKFDSPDEVRELTKLRELQRLLLTGSNLSDAGLLDLISLPSLRFLDVTETDVSRAAYVECITSKPDIEFSCLPKDF
jgi:hypothetical protein